MLLVAMYLLLFSQMQLQLQLNKKSIHVLPTASHHTGTDHILADVDVVTVLTAQWSAMAINEECLDHPIIIGEQVHK